MMKNILNSATSKVSAKKTPRSRQSIAATQSET